MKKQYHAAVTLTCEHCRATFKRRYSLHRYHTEKCGITKTFCSNACKNASEVVTINCDAVALYEAGNSIAEVAAIAGVKSATMRNHLLRSGVTLRGRADHVKAGRNPTKGKGHTEATKAKLRAATIKQFSEPEARQAAAERTIKQIQEGRTGKAFNKVEAKVAALLDAAGITFTAQKRLGNFLFDFYLPDSNTLLEVHGTFWHADPRFYAADSLSPTQERNAANDAKKAARAAREGFKLAVLWEQDVLSGAADVTALQSLGK